MSVTLSVATMTRTGGRRHNEDACGHWSAGRTACCVVADGAGGHGGGDKASKLAVENLLGRCAEVAPQIDPEWLDLAIRRTNQTLIRHRDDEPATRNMYSTVVAAVFDLERGTGLWGHCGDSRLYAFRGGRLVARTSDHSVVQSLVDSGLVEMRELRTHARRSELFSALGVDDSDLQVAVTAPWQAFAGDAFLLCTDGVWEHVDDARIEASLAAAAQPLDWLHALERSVLETTVARPRYDNYTAIAVYVA